MKGLALSWAQRVAYVYYPELNYEFEHVLRWLDRIALIDRASRDVLGWMRMS